MLSGLCPSWEHVGRWCHTPTRKREQDVLQSWEAGYMLCCQWQLHVTRQTIRMNVALGDTQAFLQLSRIGLAVEEVTRNLLSWNLPEEAMGTGVKSWDCSVLGWKSHSYSFQQYDMSPSKCSEVPGASFHMQSRAEVILTLKVVFGVLRALMIFWLWAKLTPSRWVGESRLRWFFGKWPLLCSVQLYSGHFVCM